MKVNLLTLPSRCPLCVTPAAHDETEMAVNGNGDLGMSQMAVIYFGRSRRSPTWRAHSRGGGHRERERDGEVDSLCSIAQRAPIPFPARRIGPFVCALKIFTTR